MSMPRLPMGPGGMIEVPEDMQDGVSRLVDMSVACRYLAAQCQVCRSLILEVGAHVVSGPTRQLGGSDRDARRSESFS